MQDVMIDLETLGTTPDAAILSIGAVRFDLYSDRIDNEGFYSSVSIDSNTEHGRRISESTLLWWMQQSADAQAVFHEAKTILGGALMDLREWLGDASELRVWSNGADFDIAMLSHAFQSVLGEDTPWKFYNNRCVRTYKTLPGAKDVKFPKIGTAHRALDDAINQARQVQAIYKALFGKQKVTA